jgi:hypothetical protein
MVIAVGCCVKVWRTISGKVEDVISFKAKLNYTITCPVCGQYFNRREGMFCHRALHKRPEVRPRKLVKRPDDKIETYGMLGKKCQSYLYSSFEI